MIDGWNPPNIRGNYPLGGELIGPAWSSAWMLLADGEWHVGKKISEVMCHRGRIVERTAFNLLRAARRAGILEVRRPTHRHGGNAPAEYRIAR
jgi:hypothetical protein